MSKEYTTVNNCTSSLETALKKPERDTVHFLKREGFIGEGTYEDVLDPRSMLSHLQKATTMVGEIKDRIKLASDSYKTYKTLKTHLQKYPKYEGVVKKLDEEYAKLGAAGGDDGGGDDGAGGPNAGAANGDQAGGGGNQGPNAGAANGDQAGGGGNQGHVEPDNGDNPDGPNEEPDNGDNPDGPNEARPKFEFKRDGPIGATCVGAVSLLAGVVLTVLGFVLEIEALKGVGLTALIVAVGIIVTGVALSVKYQVELYRYRKERRIKNNMLVDSPK